MISGVITAWAWGFHRILDAIELVVPEIDTTRVGATGCSRDGKAALAAGIFDERVCLHYTREIMQLDLTFKCLFFADHPYHAYVQWS